MYVRAYFVSVLRCIRTRSKNEASKPIEHDDKMDCYCVNINFIMELCVCYQHLCRKSNESKSHLDSRELFVCVRVCVRWVVGSVVEKIEIVETWEPIQSMGFIIRWLNHILIMDAPRFTSPYMQQPKCKVNAIIVAATSTYSRVMHCRFSLF